MLIGPAAEGDSRGERGFALLIVLWMLVLIGLIITHVTAVGRTEIRIATNLAANAAAEAAADGAIYQAIFNLSDPRSDYRWKTDGTTHALHIGESQITLRVEDEAARINPNLASTKLLEGLIQAIGNAPGDAPELAASIAEWVGTAQLRRRPDELLAEYRAAGLDYAPPGSPLESIEELGRVRGMTPRLLNELRPHLTLFGPAAPDSGSADPVVAAAIAFATGGGVAGRLVAPAAAADANGGVVTARIHATAQGPGNAEVTRTAIARVGPFAAAGYSILALANGAE